MPKRDEEGVIGDPQGVPKQDPIPILLGTPGQAPALGKKKQFLGSERGRRGGSSSLGKNAGGSTSKLSPNVTLTPGSPRTLCSEPPFRTVGREEKPPALGGVCRGSGAPGVPRVPRHGWLLAR